MNVPVSPDLLVKTVKSVSIHTYTKKFSGEAGILEEKNGINVLIQDDLAKPK